MWVSTSTSTDRTPWRSSAPLKASPSGPVSIKVVRGPSRTKIASPCPTSIMTMRCPEGAGGPTASASVTVTQHATPPTAHDRRGCGQMAHTAPHAISSAREAQTASRPNGTDADGTRARCDATSHVSAPAAPATPRTMRPITGTHRPSATPESPTTSARDTRGPASRFATGAINDTAPKVEAISGNVVVCATSVIDTGAASPRTAWGNAAATHASPSPPNSTSPATAATESCSPRSNAEGGQVTSETPTAAAKAAPESVLRPEMIAPVAAHAMSHARTAED